MRDIVNLTPDIFAYVGSVKENAATDYQEKKFERVSQKGDSDTSHREATNGDQEALVETDQTIAIAAADAIPSLHAQQREIVDRFVQCALNYIEKDYPLLEGETVESDHASFLTEPFSRFPASTAVIKRTTNMAETYYLIGNVLVDDKGDLYRCGIASAPQVAPRKLKLNAKSLATTAASKLVGSLAGAIGGAIGSYIFDSLFPPGVPSYFDEVYKEISRLINQGLQENNITTINGAINSVK